MGRLWSDLGPIKRHCLFPNPDTQEWLTGVIWQRKNWAAQLCHHQHHCQHYHQHHYLWLSPLIITIISITNIICSIPINIIIIANLFHWSIPNHNQLIHSKEINMITTHWYFKIREALTNDDMTKAVEQQHKLFTDRFISQIANHLAD